MTIIYQTTLSESTNMYPLNRIPTVTNISSTALVHRYCCQECFTKYELDEHLLDGNLICICKRYNYRLDAIDVMLQSIPSYNKLAVGRYSIKSLCQMLNCDNPAIYFIYDHENTFFEELLNE